MFMVCCMQMFPNSTPLSEKYNAIFANSEEKEICQEADLKKEQTLNRSDQRFTSVTSTFTAAETFAEKRWTRNIALPTIAFAC